MPPCTASCCRPAPLLLSRRQARQLAVPPHRVDEAALAAARADYLEEKRAIKAKRMRELAAPA